MAHVKVPSENSYVRYSSQTGTGPFPFTFTVFEKDDLEVRIDGAALATSAWTVSWDTSDTGGYTGGSITLNSSLTSASTVDILSITQAVRGSDFGSGPLSMTSLNTELDKLTAMIRDLQRDVARAPLLDLADTNGGDLGKLAANANKVIAVNSSGTALEFATNSGTGGGGGGGTGNVSNSGTPLNNQLAIWTNATTVEGDSGLTWDGSTLAITGAITIGGGTVPTISSTSTLTNKTIAAFTNTVYADEVHIQVFNNTGGTLTKGTPVYASGFNVGQSLVEVAKADSTLAANAMPCVGIVDADITTGSSGAVTASGRIANIDTSSFSVGDVLYVSETVGTLTTTKPTGTALVQAVAEVLRSHASSGVIRVQLDPLRSVTGFAATLLDDGSATAAQTTLSLVPGTDIAGLGTSNTYTGANDFSGGSVKVPASATPTISAQGDFALDTSVTNVNAGVLTYHDGTEQMLVIAMPTAQLSGTPTDGYVVTYNATTDDFELQQAPGAGGGITGTGVNDQLAIFSGTGTLDSSTALTYNGTTVGINDDITLNSGTGTNANITESGIDRSSTGAETFNIENSGAGAMTLQVDGVNVATISGSQTLTNKTINGDNNTISDLDIGNEVDWAAAADVSDRSATPATGDKLLIFEAGVGLRKIDWTDLPGASGVSGTGANNRVALWSGTGTLDSDANFTFDGTTFTVAGTGGITVNSGTGTNASITEGGIDRSVNGAATFNIQNSGTGAMTLQVDSVAVPTISSTSTFSNKTIDLGTNTVTGSKTEFNTALQSDTFIMGSDVNNNVETWLATPSSANLATAVTDETGSGALVFATSPTLVTPNLGTPSAATLTNATGLPISTGVSGLGAGIADFLATPSSANLATAVTNETGSGALVFGTSPTITTPRLTLESATAPTPTAEGEIWWDSDNDRIVVGDGTGQVTFSSTGITGTGANNRVAVWSGTATQDSDANLTWDGTELAVTGTVAATTIESGGGSVSAAGVQVGATASTGLFKGGTDELSVTVGGVEAIQWKEASSNVFVSHHFDSGITASATQSQGQQSLLSSFNEVSTIATNNDVVTLPVNINGRWVTVMNTDSAQTLQIFPASGDNLGEGLNTSMTIGAGESVTFFALDGTNWARIADYTASGGGFTSFSVDGDNTSPQSITDGNTLTIAGGTGITTSAGATDTVTINADAASDTAAGIVELATIAETNTGTATDRAVTPDGLDGWTGSAQVTTVGALASGSIASGFGTINIGTSNAVSCGTVELGHATDTTLARASAGNVSVEGTLLKKVGKETIWVPAPAMTARTTNGAASGSTETTTNKVMVETFDFDAATDEFVQFSVAFPKSWNAGTVTAQFFWTTADTSGNVVWACQAMALANSDALDTAFGTAQTVTDAAEAAANDMIISAATSAITIAGTPGDDELVYFQVYRDADNGSDTASSDAKLIGVKIIYTTDAANDD